MFRKAALGIDKGYVRRVDRMLVEIMPPPANRVPFPRSTWEEVESRYQPLPDDFKEFCDVYGPGAVCGEMTILHPLRSGELWMIGDVLDNEALVARHFPKDYPFPVYPSEGGLLPWAVDTNAGVYTWETVGPAATWRVVVTTGRIANRPYDRHDAGLRSQAPAP